MIIPKFLKENDTIGITACSAGVLEKLEKYELTLQVLKSNDFQITETPNVRTGGKVSSASQTRAQELESLYRNDDVKLIAIARGGDFLYDMLPYVNYNAIKENPKWISGSSDPTSLLYIITTFLDIATIYSPCNMTGLDVQPLHESYLNYFQIIKGNLVKQTKYPFKEIKPFTDELTLPNKWVNLNGPVDETGILIGGCIECLKDLIGTCFDHTKHFLEKYKNDGFIWYFDTFSMTSEDLYKTLLQFQNAGWFKYAKAILFGPVCFPNTFTDMTYEEAISASLPNIPVVFNFDVGHVKPSFTMINGMKAHIISKDSEESLEYLTQ